MELLGPDGPPTTKNHYITLHYIISQRRLHLKWPVVHQQSHIRHS